MAGKKIIWSDLARDEFHNILEFYIKRNGSPTYSLKILRQTDEILKTLSKSEYIGKLTSNKKTRVIPMQVYLIFYEVKGNIIEIISFWDNRQDENKKSIK